jgi:MFS family permease
LARRKWKKREQRAPPDLLSFFACRAAWRIGWREAWAEVDLMTQSPHRTTAIILLSSTLVFTGIGLLQTMLPMRADLEHFSAAMIGQQGAAYFAGYIGGCLMGPWLIRSVGHIRALAGVAAILAAIMLLFPVWVNPLVWLALRLCTGCCLAVTVMALESWLNDQAENQNRGRMLSLYFIVSNLGWMLGQSAVNLWPLTDPTLFMLVTGLICISVVPVALTPTREPGQIPNARLDLRGLMVLSPVGVIGAFLVGSTEGAFWTLGPVYGQQLGMSVFEVTVLMGAFVLGGTLSQWPIGHLSDNYDRRLVILPVVLLTIITGLTIAVVGKLEFQVMVPVAILHGALMVPIYSLCLAHVNDNAPADKFVQVSGGLLLIYSIGAAIGPLTAAQALEYFGPGGLFIHNSAILAVFAVIIILRMLSHLNRRVSPYRYSLTTKTTQTIYELDEP